CGGGGDDASDEIVPSVDADAGDRLPDVDIVALDGDETISLADVDGPAVVNLWATWCAPCRREIPDFEAVHRARGDEVRFVGINIGEDAEDAAAFIDDVGATYDQFLDSEGYVVTELQTATMPVTLVLDADGTISTKHLGPMDQDDLDAAIDEALAG
ncbi:MAG: TlpA family protein disulfide reductase, partial [Acidimicrobiia bacterium]